MSFQRVCTMDVPCHLDVFTQRKRRWSRERCVSECRTERTLKMPTSTYIVMYRLRIHRHHHHSRRRCRHRRRCRRHIQWAKAPKSHRRTHTLSDTLAAIAPHIHNYIYIYNSRLDGRVHRSFSVLSLLIAHFYSIRFVAAAAATKFFFPLFAVCVVLSEKS